MFSAFSVLSELLPIFFFVFLLKRNKEGMWVIFLYCIVSFTADNLFHFLQDRIIDRFYLSSSFTICEYSLFAWFLYSALKVKNFKYFLLFGSVLFYTVAIFNWSSRTTESFDSLSASVESVLMIIYCLLFLYEQIRDPSVLYIYYIKKFWIVVALLLYFSSTLFLFISAATLTKQEHTNFWLINNIFNILKNILFSISFFIKTNNKKAHHSTETIYADIQ